MGVGDGGGGAYKLLGSMLSSSRGVFMSRRSVGVFLVLRGYQDAKQSNQGPLRVVCFRAAFRGSPVWETGMWFGWFFVR